ncbi:hypothetical protein ACFQZE_16820 [Paenibacillus sp. GCM10027627]
MYLGTVEPISNQLIKDYSKKYSIAIDRINAYLKAPTTHHYYTIHLQCACDFIGKNAKYAEETIRLFKSVQQPFEVILLDASKNPNTDEKLNVLIADRPLTETLSVDEWLTIYPAHLSVEKIYCIA